MQTRREQKPLHILTPDTNKGRPEIIICFPLTGAMNGQPTTTIPVEDVSYPTQASDQRASTTEEVVFSNGRCIRLEHGAYHQKVNNSRASNVGTGNMRDIRQGEPNVPKRPPKPPRHPEYADFAQRLKTYARWWKRHPDPVTLCEAGLFYTDKEDLVRCYHCGIGLKDFSDGDNPLMEHVRHSENCSYFHTHLGAQGLANIKRQIQAQDHRRSRVEHSDLESGCRHPEYQSYGTRLSSYCGWPPGLVQTPYQLAEAGLYYTGFGDSVRCFACDGGLRQWDPEDDPWIEHCRWFPKCPYVKQQKGDEYIALVQTASSPEIEVNQPGRATTTRNNTGIASEMERLTLRDPELNAVISEHRSTCLEMGYSEIEFSNATISLAKIGTIRPTIEDILDAIETEKQTENPPEPPKYETPVEENTRLKRMVICDQCNKNATNALFLPCSHHRLCMSCAQPLIHCPFCDSKIRQKIKTYLS